MNGYKQVRTVDSRGEKIFPLSLMKQLKSFYNFIFHLHGYANLSFWTCKFMFIHSHTANSTINIGVNKYFMQLNFLP